MCPGIGGSCHGSFSGQNADQVSLSQEESFFSEPFRPLEDDFLLHKTLMAVMAYRSVQKQRRGWMQKLGFLSDPVPIPSHICALSGKGGRWRGKERVACRASGKLTAIECHVVASHV